MSDSSSSKKTLYYNFESRKLSILKYLLQMSAGPHKDKWMEASRGPPQWYDAFLHTRREGKYLVWKFKYNQKQNSGSHYPIFHSRLFNLTWLPESVDLVGEYICKIILPQWTKQRQQNSVPLGTFAETFTHALVRTIDVKSKKRFKRKPRRRRAEERKESGSSSSSSSSEEEEEEEEEEEPQDDEQNPPEAQGTTHLTSTYIWNLMGIREGKMGTPYKRFSSSQPHLPYIDKDFDVNYVDPSKPALFTTMPSLPRVRMPDQLFYRALNDIQFNAEQNDEDDDLEERVFKTLQQARTQFFRTETSRDGDWTRYATTCTQLMTRNVFASSSRAVDLPPWSWESIQWTFTGGVFPLVYMNWSKGSDGITFVVCPLGMCRGQHINRVEGNRNDNQSENHLRRQRQNNPELLNTFESNSIMNSSRSSMYYPPPNNQGQVPLPFNINRAADPRQRGANLAPLSNYQGQSAQPIFRRSDNQGQQNGYDLQ